MKQAWSLRSGARQCGKYVLDCAGDSGLSEAAIALGPSHEVQPIPYGLVSLWDMINFNVGVAHGILGILRMEARSAEEKARLAEISGPKSGLASQVDAHSLEMSETIVNKCSEIFSVFQAPAIEDRIKKINNPLLVGLSKSWRDHHSDLKFLLETIESELKRQYFYHYPKERGLLVFRVSDDWAATLNAFPSAEDDVKSAVDCYALGHNHASIYHCMMILERGLPALAKKVGAKFKKERPTWKDMTDAIRARIDARRNALVSPPKGSKPLSTIAAQRERRLLEAAGEAVIEFKFFEHAWRNHIAHGRAAYDENDAKKVLDHVRAFMELIATKLKLKET